VMLRYFERAQAVKAQIHPSAHRRLSQPPAKAREWRDEMRPQDLAVFEALAGSTLERFGYPRALRTVPATARLRGRFTMTVVNARRLRRASAKRWHTSMRKRNRKRRA
ncbi:MAG: hypothetical protein ACRDH7_13130, partial [Actinomycetota bacterium]